MIPFMMVVLDELVNRSAQRAFAHKDQSVQARFFDRPHEALRARSEIWGASGKRTVWTPAAASVSRNASVNSGSRSPSPAIVLTLPLHSLLTA
jgi:hypothetical protein